MILKRAVLLALLASVGALLTRAFISSREEMQHEREREMPIKLPPRVQSTSAGGFKIVLDRETQELAGIEVKTLHRTAEGVMVPASALLRQDGQVWLYVQGEPGEFIRKAIKLGKPTSEGWAVPTATQETVVTVGAQILLSEELKAQIQILEEGR